jgi:5-methylcytosine-specific restriction enzyme subunit McrC
MHAAIPARTVTLTERAGRVCRLAPADVDYLLAHHRTHFELTPTGRRHVYRLTPAGVAGVVVAPTCRLVVRPKVPLVNLFHLLDPLAPLPAAADGVTPTPGTEALDFLAGQFALRLAERAGAGLHRAYRERAAEGPFLHGALDLPAQLRDAPGRKDRLHCHYDDFTADVPCNRVLRATADLLLGSPLVGEGVKATLRQALPGFEGVQSPPPGPTAFDAAARDRPPADYGALLDLCRLLAEGLAPGEGAGATPAPAFLLDMERVFERHVTRGLAAGFAAGGDHSVSVQPTYTVNVPVPGQPDVAMRPDVTVDGAGGPVLVVDAKWKRLPGAAPVTADLYQVLAYCTALGVGRAVLVYPGRRDRAWDYRFPHTPIRVTVRTLRVVGSREALARSLRRLVRALRPGRP